MFNLDGSIGEYQWVQCGSYKDKHGDLKTVYYKCKEYTNGCQAKKSTSVRNNVNKHKGTHNHPPKIKHKSSITKINSKLKMNKQGKYTIKLSEYNKLKNGKSLYQEYLNSYEYKKYSSNKLKNGIRRNYFKCTYPNCPCIKYEDNYVHFGRKLKNIIFVNNHTHAATPPINNLSIIEQMNNNVIKGIEITIPLSNVK